MSKQKIKYPSLDNIEYFDVMKNKETVLTLNGLECNGLSWRQIQELVGKKAGAGLYRYSFKQTTSPQINNGSLRAIGDKRIKETLVDVSLLNQLNSLKSELQSIKNNSGTVGTDLLISLTRQGYDTQINFLNLQIGEKQKVIDKLENEIDKLENELSEQDLIIDDLKSKTGVNQYIALAQDFLKIKNNSVQKLSLKDSNSDDIPKDILDILGLVNWSEVEPNVLNEIIKYLNMFIPKLPLKNRG